MINPMDRVILHCDLNNFFASVECIKDPSLVGKPIAVCGNPEKRKGIVLAKSEQAKKFGVKTGMVIWEAKQICPDLIIVSTNHADYEKYSKKVREVYYRFTDKVESFGCDECWLDVTDSQKLFGPGITIADKLREITRTELGLTISVGVSFNKTFAKLGSDLKKPDATSVISRDNYREIVFPMPVTNLLFVGRKTKNLFAKLNIKTIGDLAAFDEKTLSGFLGINAEKLISAARGEDDIPVMSYTHFHTVKSVGNGTTTPHDITTIKEAEQIMYLLSEEIAYRMRKKGVKGFTISLSIRTPELNWLGAQQSIPQATNSSRTISEAAMKIFKKLMTATKNACDPVRSLRISMGNLTYDSRIQLNLFEQTSSEEKNDKISAVFDKLRAKHGTGSIYYANLLKSDFNLHFDVTDEEY